MVEVLCRAYLRQLVPRQLRMPMVRQVIVVVQGQPAGWGQQLQVPGTVDDIPSARRGLRIAGRTGAAQMPCCTGKHPQIQVEEIEQRTLIGEGADDFRPYLVGSSSASSRT